jgi:hypothetical protein
MARRLRLESLALPILVVALLSPLSPVHVSPVSAGDSTRPADETLFVQVRGTGDRQPGSPPDRLVYVLDVFDMRNQKIGTVTHDLKFTSATTADLVSSFHLPRGDVVNRGVEAIAPDSTKQGFYLIGVHSDQDTIQGDKSTGDYAGRGGRLRMSGWHDGNTLPQRLTVNDFYEIALRSPA